MPEFDSTVEYRDVEGFPRYRVGSDGTVWSHRQQAGTSPHYERLKPYVERNGYCRVTLCRAGRTYRFCVHQLVLIAFVGPAPAGTEACHFPDRSRANNRLSNLRWDTRDANRADMVLHDTVVQGERNGHAKLTDTLVREIRAKYIRGVFGGKRLAAMYGVDKAMIWRIVNNKAWQHLLVD